MPLKIVLLTSVLAFLLMNTATAQPTAFEIQGHRGARGLMPENTIPAFIRAIDEGVQTLELDVVITRDGKVVVSHEPYFNPLISTDPDGKFVAMNSKTNIFMMDYKRVKKFDVGKRGNMAFPDQEAVAAYKPLLKDVIKMAEKYAWRKGVAPLKYNIELKSLEEEYDVSQPYPEVFSEMVKRVVFKKLPKERVTIQSFDFNILKYWHQQMKAGAFPKCSLSALIEPEENNDVQMNLIKLGFKPEVWSPYYQKLTPEIVEKLHSMNIRVIPWTVNTVDDMKKMKAIGCDGLITDYPNRAKDLTE